MCLHYRKRMERGKKANINVTWKYNNQKKGHVKKETEDKEWSNLKGWKRKHLVKGVYNSEDEGWINTQWMDNN